MWPSIMNVTKMATSVFTRMKNKGDWVADVKTKSSAYLAADSPSAKPHPSGGSSFPGANRECWNCGSKDHLLPDCPKPRD